MQDRVTPLGVLVRQRRLDLSLSLRDVEALSGMSRARLSRVEQGQRNLTPESLALLAQPLQLPLADLYEAAGFPIPGQLPSIRPYLRHAYSASETAVEEIERYLAAHSPGFTPGVGPAPGEDEDA